MKEAAVDNHIQQMFFDGLLSASAGRKLGQIMNTIAALQEKLYALSENEDGRALELMKAATVFQIFYIDTLASGKKADQLTYADWRNIAMQVSRCAVLEEEQTYSEFVFSLYADYIDLSAEAISVKGGEDRAGRIRVLADELRQRTNLFHMEQLGESQYVEDCLWLSLEAMFKLLSVSVESALGKRAGSDYAQLVQGISDLAFEYGRYVLYAREQEMLADFLENQRALDEQLEKQFEAYLADVRVQADHFQQLVENAFSQDVQDMLHHSVELAREAGVKEGDVLRTVEDVDVFFLE